MFGLETGTSLDDLNKFWKDDMTEISMAINRIHSVIIFIPTVKKQYPRNWGYDRK